MQASANQNFIQACRAGDVSRVIQGLQDLQVIPAALAIRWAAWNGHTDIVSILMQDARVDPAAEDNISIRLAAGRGYTDMVALLLQDARVDPAAKNNEAIRLAAKQGYTDVVQLLLYDPRIWMNPPDLTAPEFEELRRLLESQLEAVIITIHVLFQQRWQNDWLYEPALQTLVEQYLPLELYRVLEHHLRTGAYDPALLQAWIQRLSASY